MSDLIPQLRKGTRKAIDGLPPLRRVVKSRPVQHVVQVMRGAGVVAQPLRFTLFELGGSRTASHRLRASGLTILLRHQTRDVNILNEIFGGTSAHLCYEPPAAVAARLDLDPAPRVLDLGANIGLFGVYAMGRWPRARIHSFEPDPANLNLLRRVVEINGLGSRWSVTDAAVANRRGAMSFEAGRYSDSRLVVPAAAESEPAADSAPNTIDVQSVDIYAEEHDVSLLKMDIEGGEWSILTDPRLGSLKADAIVLEWHTRGSPESDARAAAARLLQAAGYVNLEDVEYGQGSGVLWAWREDPSAA
jgi:FkbM family methyltransferase